MVSIKTQLAADVLQNGGVIAYPTEAVWGLGCDPDDGAAIQRILQLKKRSPDKGLILVAADITQFAPYLSAISDAQRGQLEQCWPGPFTFLVPDNGRAHPLVRGQFTSVALRVSAHPQVMELCRRFGGPIVSTSANEAGMPALKHGWQVAKQFADQLDYLLPGPLGKQQRPSEIRDLATGKVIRQG